MNESNKTLVSNLPWWKKWNEKQVHNRISEHGFHLCCSVRDPWEEERDTHCKMSTRTLEETFPSISICKPFHRLSSSTALSHTLQFCFCSPQGEACVYAQKSEIFSKLCPVQGKSTNRICIYGMLICLVQSGSIWLIFGFLQKFHDSSGLKVGTMELKRFYLNFILNFI